MKTFHQFMAEVYDTQVNRPINKKNVGGLAMKSGDNKTQTSFKTAKRNDTVDTAKLRAANTNKLPNANAKLSGYGVSGG